MFFEKTRFVPNKILIENVAFKEVSKIEVTAFAVSVKYPLHKRVWYGVTKPFRRKR